MKSLHLSAILMMIGCSHSDPSAEAESAETTAEAVRPSAQCDLPGVRSVAVPMDYAAPERRLELRYRFFPSARPDARTIVVVPGGPGEAIMQSSPSGSFPLGAISSDRFNVIYADARGSGCNVYPTTASPTYSLEAVARDVLAVVKAEGLTDYLLYGVSFGTAAATVAVAIAEAEGVTPPRRVVLEGTLGRAMSFADYTAAFAAEWTRVKPLLAPAWRTALDAEPWPAELFWSREQWGSFIAQQLILGDLPGAGPILKYWLDGLSRKDSAAQAYVGTFMAGTGGPPPELFRTIACRELWGSWQTGREVRDGELRAIGPDLCEGRGLTAPYDSARWQFRVPVTYFQGPYDPTTTMAQAELHMAAHRSADRQFVVVPGASHAPLTMGLAGRHCAAVVWEALDSDATKLEPTLASCDPAMTFRHLPPE
jgi:pimeloyl-ACP methyl ester carboxylesterase